MLEQMLRERLDEGTDGVPVGGTDRPDELPQLLRGLADCCLGPRLQLLRNVYPGGGAFLAVELRGNGTTSNRDAIGARVNVDLGDRVVARTLYAGDGFLAQSSKWIHFGLGSADTAEVRVQWPDGETGPWLRIDANQFAKIERGATEPVLWVLP